MLALEKVDIVFAAADKRTVESLLDAGESNESIREKTGAIVGARDINLAVPVGEICVLMGLSGSGKSTVLRAVNGLNSVLRGKVKVGESKDAIDVANCDAASLRQLRLEKIAMVFQSASLLPWLSVAENVGFGLDIRGVKREEKNKSVRDKLAMVNLSEWAECRPHELSGGMQQRVGLARAFAADPDILLMDEPFSALDPLIRQQLQDELLRLQKEVKKTVLFVSHDLDEALKLGDKIAIMRAGEIAQIGPPEEIVLSPANDYIARFVAHINPLNVLRARTVMQPLQNGGDDSLEKGMSVFQDAPLREIIALMEESGKKEGSNAIAVRDNDGIIGAITDSDIRRALVGIKSDG